MTISPQCIPAPMSRSALVKIALRRRGLPSVLSYSGISWNSVDILLLHGMMTQRIVGSDATAMTSASNLFPIAVAVPFPMRQSWAVCSALNRKHSPGMFLLGHQSCWSRHRGPGKENLGRSGSQYIQVVDSADTEISFERSVIALPELGFYLLSGTRHRRALVSVGFGTHVGNRDNGI